MAKAGFDIGFTAYSHRDPVSGSVKTVLRTKHSRQSSPRLRAHKACMRRGMEGKTFRGQGAVQDSRNIRETFAAVSRQCAGSGGRA